MAEKLKDKAQDLFSEAFRSLENAAEEPANRIQAGARLMIDALTRHSESVAFESQAVKEKIKRGSRLTNYRYPS